MKESDIGKIYSDGEVIFREGDEGKNMFVVQSGKVTITKKVDSRELKIATLGSGEIFGEMALFDSLPRSATATSVGESRVLTIDRTKLLSSISKEPTMAFKIIEAMSKRIRRLDEDFTKLKKQKMDLLYVCADVDETCNLIMEQTKNLINAEHGSVMLLDVDETSLIIKSAFGPESNSKARLKVGEGIAGDVLRTGKAELINNVTMDARFKPGGTSVKSMLCVPLKVENKSIGVINVSNNQEKLFNLDDLKLLHALAIYASIAIQNAQHFSSLKNITTDYMWRASIDNW